MHYMRKKRGRPCQHRPKIDQGTIELQQKRTKLLENKLNQDRSLAESLLGVLFAHQVISQPLYEAGCFFGELGYRYRPCLGYTFRHQSHVWVPHLERVAYQEKESIFTESQEEKRTKAWRQALETLKQTGSRPYQVVLNVVFYSRDLYTEALPLPPPLEIKALQKGLEQLEAYFKGELKGKTSKLSDSAPNSPLATRIQSFLRESRSASPP
jgi:hypothetical protein